ncbi:MAG: hypothetical protein ABIG55_05405 [Candidatus Omnitrophota bacterium]|nr:hypothetical protein [Candidatus Omnitrophota bacterium]
MRAKCPECNFDVPVDFNNEEGDSIWCDHCDATLKIVSMDPVRLKVIEKSEDDVTEEYLDEQDGDEENSWDD